MGRYLTKTLASGGYHAYAGARTDRETAELNVIKNIDAERLDVTIQDLIHAAVAFVKKQDNSLYALVSTAGIGGGPVPPTPIEDQSSLCIE